MPAGFQVPGIVENEEGWGPTSVPEHLEGVPYAPYGKGDKVGRVSDFTQSGFNKYGGECMLLHVQALSHGYHSRQRSERSVDKCAVSRSLWEPEHGKLPSSLQLLVQRRRKAQTPLLLESNGTKLLSSHGILTQHPCTAGGQLPPGGQQAGTAEAGHAEIPAQQVRCHC